MSEAELHVIKARFAAAFHQQCDVANIAVSCRLA